MIDYSCFMSESVGTRGTRARHLFSRYLQHDTMAEGRGDYILKQLEEQNPWYVGFFFPFIMEYSRHLLKNLQQAPMYLLPCFSNYQLTASVYFPFPTLLRRKSQTS